MQSTDLATFAAGSSQFGVGRKLSPAWVGGRKAANVSALCAARRGKEPTTAAQPAHDPFQLSSHDNCLPPPRAASPPPQSSPACSVLPAVTSPADSRQEEARRTQPRGREARPGEAAPRCPLPGQVNRRTPGCTWGS